MKILTMLSASLPFSFLLADRSDPHGSATLGRSPKAASVNKLGLASGTPSRHQGEGDRIDEGVAALAMVSRWHAVPSSLLQAPRNVTKVYLPGPPSLPVDEEASLRAKLAQGLPSSSALNLTLTRQGFAGARTLCVAGDRGELFAKVFLFWPENKKPADFAREILGATFAGNVGLAPRVLYGNAEAGVMVSDSVANLFAGDHNGDKQPRIGLSFALLDRLRVMTQGDVRRPVDASQMRRSFLQALRRLPADRRRDPALALVKRVALEVVDVRLRGHSFRPSLTHGDFQHGNVLVDSPTKAYLIDWESYAFGDAATDVASYFGRYSYRPEAMLRHAHLLDHFDAADWRRAQLYLVYARAAEYLKKSLGGRPWDAPERREAELAQLAEHLRADEGWLRQA